MNMDPTSAMSHTMDMASDNMASMMASDTMAMASDTVSSAMSHTMSMASSAMSSAMSHTMSMASHTMSMASSATTAMGEMGGMGGMGGMSMSGNGTMSSMARMKMNMWFRGSYMEYPLVFRDLKATNAGQGFGLFLFLFVVAFLARMLEFIRNYLEEVTWKNKNYAESQQGIAQHSATLAAAPKACCVEAKENGTAVEHAKVCDSDLSVDKVDSPQGENNVPKRDVSFGESLFRDIIRLTLCIVPDLFAYFLMLAAMTYCLLYFFAVVAGSGIGRFVAERMMEHYRLKRTCPRAGGACC